jgi:predicted ester cyclase
MTDLIEQKRITAALQHDAFERGELSGLDGLVTPDFVDHAAPPGTPAGPDAVRSVVGFLHGAFDDIRYEIHQMVAEDDTVAFRCTFSATHARPFLGVPPTGRRVSSAHQHMVRFRDGKIAEHWAVRDDLAMMRQLTGGDAGDQRDLADVTR